MGAWIETYDCKHLLRTYLSHPTWVRGLKLLCIVQSRKDFWSHPTWVRGLKHARRHLRHNDGVAPYVGAWIETMLSVFL